MQQSVPPLQQGSGGREQEERRAHREHQNEQYASNRSVGIDRFQRLGGGNGQADQRQGEQDHVNDRLAFPAQPADHKMGVGVPA
ncbi:MAG TPA: hypothetical protein QGI39_02805 [Gammaproteobacteria bacterium]|nr:hypothetical protein [Gammaproteobacteria bacterium]